MIPRPTGHTPPPVSPQERRAVCRRVPPAALGADRRGLSDASSAVRALRGVGRPVGRVLSRRLPRAVTIHLRCPLPAASCDLPGCSGGPPSNASCLILLRVGFAEPSGRPAAGGLLHHRFTLTRCPRPGGLCSVALFRGLPRVAVGHHPALWSPDLPRPATTELAGEPRPPGRPTRGGV